MVLSVVFHRIGPDGGFLELDDLREGQLEAAAAMVMAVTAAVVLGRFRRHGSRRMLVVAAALFALAAGNLFAAVAIPLVDSLAESRGATWTAAGIGAVGAALLALAAIMPDRTLVHRPRAMAAVLSGTAASLAIIATGSWLFGSSLPSAFDTIPRRLEDLALVEEHSLLLFVEAATAVAYAVAAIRFGSLAAFDDLLMRWLSFASVIATAGFVNYALFPSQFTELLYSGDAFFLATLVTLLLGAILEITGTEAALVRASRRLRATAGRRLSSELVWPRSSRSWPLRRNGSRAGPRSTIESASSHSRSSAHSTSHAARSPRLVRPVDESVALAIAHAATDAGDQFGARVELRLDDAATVSREWRDALVRTARASVAMAVRHRGAGAVTIELRSGRRVVLRIVDDGRSSSGGDGTAERSSSTCSASEPKRLAECSRLRSPRTPVPFSK